MRSCVFSTEMPRVTGDGREPRLIRHAGFQRRCVSGLTAEGNCASRLPFPSSSEMTGEPLSGERRGSELLLFWLFCIGVCWCGGEGLCTSQWGEEGTDEG